MPVIEFQVNKGKVLEAIVYLANKCPGIDIYHTVKTIFYADKNHLNRYARPVLGDVYIKMENGPVPSLVRDIITKSVFLPKDFLTQVSEAIETKGHNKNITAKRNANLDDFSESDISCLNEALDLCKDKSFDELRDSTHAEKAWIDAYMNGNMSYELMIDDDNPYKDDIIADLRENSSGLVF